MPISVFHIKRWIKMVSGNSAEHVNQTIGLYFSQKEIKGYYNNLTDKVNIEPKWLDTDKIITVKQAGGENIIFPVAVFQYALGCYDLYLQTKDGKYLSKFLHYARWTLDTQDFKGRWNNFSYTYKDYPYGAMCQGEGASVLIRAYCQTKDEIFLEAAKKAIDSMLVSDTKGGMTLYKDGDVLFREYTHLPIVLNGWIFAWWGLFDYVLITHNEDVYKDLLNKSCNSLIKYLPQFSNCYWSKYDLSKAITSPFYHRLHIAQMEVMYTLTGKNIFKDYANRWNKQLHNPCIKYFSFIVKAIQKILE